MVNLRFAKDEDCLRYEPNLDEIWPRLDPDTGERRRDWDVQHQLAMNDIERWLRSQKTTADRFDIGKIGHRSREDLRDCAACQTLHYIFVAADTQGDPTGYFARKQRHYAEMSMSIFRASTILFDYDTDGDDVIESDEKELPMPPRFIRGG